MGKISDINGHKANIIEAGTILKGQINAKGALRVDGEIEGTVICDGKLVVGEKGKVMGDIRCINAEVMGHLQGKITIEQLLTVKATAVVDGEIKTSKLSIEANAIFTGTCDMGKDNMKNASVK